MSLSRRRQPRIRYRGALRIVDKSAGRALEATGLDLSAGGIGVRASGAYAVGSDVVCELEVNGRAVALPGTVAWSVPPEPPAAANEERKRDSRRVTQGLYRLGASAAAEAEAITEYVIDTTVEEREDEPVADERPDTKTLLRLGAAEAHETPMGICFAPLIAEQSRVLDDLMREGEPLTSPVQLFLRGVSAPVSVRAEAHEHGIRLRSTLPFLALGSEVRFRVADGEEHLGRVQNVTLVDREAREGPRLEIEIGERAAPNAARANAAELREAELMPPTAASTRAATRVKVAMGMFIGIAVGAAAMWLADRHRPRVETARAEHASQEPVRAPEPAQAAPTVAARADEQLQTQSNANPAAPSALALPTPEPIAAETPSESPSPPSAASPAVAAPNSQSSPAAPPAEVVSAPQVSVEGPYTRVFIPMQGSDEEIGRYELTSPGLVVSLPHARALIPLEDYPIYRGIVRRVWLRSYRDGVQARLVWRPGPGHAKVVFDENGLTLTVRPF